MYDEQVLSYRYAGLTCAGSVVSARWYEARKFEFEACLGHHRIPGCTYDELVLSYRYAGLTCAGSIVSSSWCETRRFEFEACLGHY